MPSDNEKKCASCGRIFRSEGDFMRNTSRWRVCSEENLWFNCVCGSTLILKKGKYPWYSPAQGLSDDGKRLFESLRQKDSLPYIRSAVFQLQDKLQSPEFDVDEVAKILRHEPLLLGEVIALAGRLKKARGQDDAPITGLVHALSYVGRRMLADLVLVAALKMVKVGTKEFDSASFWQHSFLTAVLSEKICKRFAPHQSPEDAYLGGFLCNIGKIVASVHFPDEVDAIVRACRSPLRAKDWLSLEREGNFHDHRVLGEVACAFWGLPSHVLDSVMKHHDVPSADYPGIEVYEVVGLANQLSHWILLDPQRINRALLDSLSRRFGLDDLGMEALVVELSSSQILSSI